MIITKDTLMDIAAGLHWYCSENYNGQADDLYAVMCELQYKPGATESSCPTIEACNTYEYLMKRPDKVRWLLERIKACQSSETTLPSVHQDTDTNPVQVADQNLE